MQITDSPKFLFFIIQSLKFEYTSKPMFVASGTGSSGLSTLGGYQLRLESPCINTKTKYSGKKVD